MEAASTSETSVNFYQITRRSNPEDNHLHTRYHENLKSSGPFGFRYMEVLLQVHSKLLLNYENIKTYNT
jgi:hypothetical protein